MNEEETSLQVITDADMVFQTEKASVDVQVATSHAFPRNIRKATDNALAIATIDKETAATCTYSVPRGGKAITGPSVHLAKILAQTWGNMRVEAKVIAVDAKQITSQAIAWDLESNLAIKVEVKRSIMGRAGRFNDDMIVVTGNAANSIALRNAVFAVIPKAVVDKVYNASKQLITGDLSDETKLISKRKQVVDAIRDTYEVKESEIFTAVGKTTINHLTPDDLVVLIGIGTAIKDGDTTVEEAFRRKAKSEASASDVLTETKSKAQESKQAQTKPVPLTKMDKEKNLTPEYEGLVSDIVAKTITTMDQIKIKYLISPTMEKELAAMLPVAELPLN